MFNASIGRGGRNCNHKWCVGFDDIPNRNVFPLYVSGNIFILTQDLLHELCQTALTITFFWIEDVFITGFVPEAMKNVNFVFLDQYMELGDIQNYIAQVTHILQQEDGTVLYFALATAHPFQIMCAWAIKILYMTYDEVEVFGGLERQEVLWKQLTRPTLLIYLHQEIGALPISPRNKGTQFSFGFLCSSLLNVMTV